MKDEWYYKQNDAIFGPISRDELQGLAQNGTLLPTDYIRHDPRVPWIHPSEALFETKDQEDQSDCHLYAGFWKRFAALIIDGIIVSLAFILFVLAFIPFVNELTGNEIRVLIVLVSWPYFAGMESSRQQGTLGKILLGIKVTDLSGQPISFGKASIRHFSKIISGFILYVGYIMAAFTPKKQALHDQIAYCLVVNRIEYQIDCQEYAGFWKRFAALVVDGIVVSLAFIPFVLAIIPFANDSTDKEFIGLIFLASWLYFAGMESSRQQGTLGKILLGIKVTDLSGQPISFGKASIRHFSKIISGFILYVGYIMAAFTPKKQALHDQIANCLVVNR